MQVHLFRITSDWIPCSMVEATETLMHVGTKQLHLSYSSTHTNMIYMWDLAMLVFNDICKLVCARTISNVCTPGTAFEWLIHRNIIENLSKLINWNINHRKIINLSGSIHGNPGRWHHILPIAMGPGTGLQGSGHCEVSRLHWVGSWVARHQWAPRDC